MLKIMKVTDPVCGLEFDEDLSVTHEYNSKEYHFCCDGCKKIFIKKPKKWSKKSKQKEIFHTFYKTLNSD